MLRNCRIINGSSGFCLRTAGPVAYGARSPFAPVFAKDAAMSDSVRHEDVLAQVRS
jgi:hypothetical protein